MRYHILGASRKIEYDMRNEYFAYLLTLPMSFYHKYKTGDLMARAISDLNAVRNFLGPGIMHGINNLMVFIFVVTFMALTNLKLTLLSLIPFPFILVIAKLSLQYIFDTYKSAQSQYSTITAKAQENIAGMRVIKAYVQEENEAHEFENLNKTYLGLNLKLTKIQALLYSSLTFLMGIGMMILLWLGGHFISRGTMMIGDFVAFTVWLGMLAWPMVSFGWIMNMIQEGAASMSRINEVLSQNPDIRDDENTDSKINVLHGAVEFRNLSFSYDGATTPILNNINLSIPPGKTYAITGPTGSGKTTLVNLIPRLFESDNGQVLIDGVDVKKIPLKILRENIGYVPQETFLFSESISDNISFGVKTVTIDEIQEAATASTINVDLEGFTEKYETLVGERGITLSGGQKQRTALARAIIRKPKILILDDAFSSVDSATEERILQHFRTRHVNQTNIIISQRISTIKNADHIIVLDQGKIMEQGTHDSLLRHNGFYARLYRKQLLEADLEKL